jgi:hypothetical protein
MTEKPSNYKQTVADTDLAKMLRKFTDGSTLLISPPKRSELTQPGSWMACVRSGFWRDPPPASAGQAVRTIPQPMYFAVFFEGSDLVASRRAVIIDRCEQEQFSSLPSLRPARH